MATTTNYGWTTPDDTALVKDGAAAIRTLGSSVDTTLKAQIDAQIPDSLLTTKGDLIAATGASTPARLGVGANGQILTADSTAATGIKWATPAGGGSWSQSATGTLSGASVTISSLAGQRYWVFLANWAHDQTGTTRNAVLRFNGDTGANYYGPNFNDTFGRMAVGQDSGAGFSNSASAFVELANTSARKPIVNGNYNSGVDGAVWNNTSAITSITIALSGAGNFTNGTYYVWSFA